MTDWHVCYTDALHEKPAEIDKTSSPTTVYVRKDFELVPGVQIEGETEKAIDQWKFLQKEYTQEEYAMIVETASKAAESISIKHENDIKDEYTLELIEGGLL